LILGSACISGPPLCDPASDAADQAPGTGHLPPALRPVRLHLLRRTVGRGFRFAADTHLTGRVKKDVGQDCGRSTATCLHSALYDGMHKQFVRPWDAVCDEYAGRHVAQDNGALGFRCPIGPLVGPRRFDEPAATTQQTPFQQRVLWCFDRPNKRGRPTGGRQRKGASICPALSCPVNRQPSRKRKIRVMPRCYRRCDSP